MTVVTTRQFRFFATAGICLVAALVTCKKSSETENSDGKFMSENSRRRLATPDETVGIYKLKTYGGNWCTAFSVRNEGGKAIVLSARHCTNFTPEDWCQKISTIVTANEEKTYKCKQILFNAPDFDVFAMELDQPLDDKGLILSSVDPSPGMHLRMTGFPTDQYGKSLGGPVTTDNCWVLNRAKERYNIAVNINPLPYAMFHNCSTYGGNSGGPMLIEGSDIVIGEPASYTKSQGNQYSFDTGAAVYTAADWIKAHPDYVSANKLVTVSSLPEGDPKVQYIPELKCVSPQLADNPIERLVPLYKSESDFFGMKVKFKKNGEYVQFNCNDKKQCEDGSGSEVFEVKSASEMTYTKVGKVAKVTCEPYSAK